MTTPSLAMCHIDHGIFHVAWNDSITKRAVSDGVCHDQYVASGRRETAFTSATLVSPPHNGTLTKTGPFAFVYRAKSGYKGQDVFTMKVCGTQAAGSGCSKITYDMTVD
jgi:hypothetical protein